MSLLADITESFRPNFSPSMKPLRVGAISLGLICLIGSVAAKIFETMSIAQIFVLAGFGVSLMISGALGSLGLLALTVIVAGGMQTAFSPPPLVRVDILT